MDRLSLVEQETIIRFDRTDAPAILYTASPNQAEQWRKLGYDIQPHGPQGWQALIPKAAVRFRRLVEGRLKKRPVSEAFLASRRKGKVASQD